MKKEELIETVADTAFVSTEECERVLVSFEKVFTREVKAKIKKYLIITGSVVAFIGILATVFYFLGKRCNCTCINEEE